MKKQWNKTMSLFLYLCIFYSIQLNAQNGLSTNAGARGLSMANTSVNFQDINSIFSNQAGLVHLTDPSVLLFAEQRFALQEIRSIAAGFAYPTKSGVFGLNIQYFGFEDYNEQKIGLAYSRRLMEKLSLGAQVNYLSFRIPEYGNSGFLSFEIGVQAEILEGLLLGAHIANPIGQEIVADDNLPTVFKLGLAYNPSKKVILSMEVEKDIDFDIRIKGSLEYFLVEALTLRAGFANNPGTFSFGVGFSIKEQLKIDVGTSYHQILGFSPGIGIVFLIKK